MSKHLDIEALLAPIPGDNAAGEDLRYTQVYDDIKEARRADDLFAMGEWQRETKTSDWEKVIALCQAALSERTKDLQIAAWLTEALVMTAGFGGLAAGLRVMRGYLDQYWESVYPVVEGDDLDYRIAPFEFLNDKLWSAVKQVPLTEPGVTSGYSLLKWQESREVGSEADTKNKYGDIDEQKKKKRDELIAEGKMAAEEFDVAILKSSASFYKSCNEELASCLEAFNALDKLVDEKFGSDAPRLSDLGQAIDECARLVTRVCREQKGGEAEPVSSQTVAPSGTSVKTEIPEVFQEQKPAAEPAVASLVPATSLSVPPVLTAVGDEMSQEKVLWDEALRTMESGGFKSALDRLLAAAYNQPTGRGQNRYRFLVAKLCLKAGRPDLARPIVEQLHTLIAELQLERWESSLWIAEVLEALYQCLMSGEPSDDDMIRGNELFKRICTMDVTKAIVYKK